MELEDLRGKVAVITGASSGIGEAVARQLAAEGMTVVLAARRKARIDQLAAQLGKAAIALEVDVGNHEQVTSLFDFVAEHFGGLDLLVNNAGMGIAGRFEASTPDDWHTQIDANLYGVLNCTHRAIPLMKGRPGAMIATVSSVGGKTSAPNWALYCATKFAVSGFCDGLRQELASDGVRVSVIHPGAVHTEWGHNVPAQVMQERRNELQALLPADVARALVYSFAQPPSVLLNDIEIRPSLQLTL
ncbi:SDR family oxidoreductase [Aeromonas dhakensis]|uniref:SDR family oxidoreductase n=1 Tax=Aeromonas dhakensis TaxID=196024 RepID=UPI00197D743C|nr:SDR family oxidoreductase [Aeromonas dhakensis]MBW3731331.1 SDR family oxidoreductase [Aeromonas dhakensis]QSR55958.1 SDR family NAD(P)-dependent oxidoreductase [Aeromonas dhakensis]